MVHERSQRSGEITRRSSEAIARSQLRIYSYNFSGKALHGLACRDVPSPRMMQVLTQVLCRLLSNPEYIEPLRREVEVVIEEEGWTKAGIDKMCKLDSFLRETQRIDTLGIGLSGFSP